MQSAVGGGLESDWATGQVADTAQQGVVSLPEAGLTVTHLPNDMLLPSAPASLLTATAAVCHLPAVGSAAGQTPELLADVEVPESVSILGQSVDLSQVRSLLQPVSQGLSGIISQVRG